MLKMINISKSFAGVSVLRKISLTIAQNTITAIVGPNGAGKTTLFDVISGFVRAEEGQVFLQGRELTGLDPYERSRQGLARTFQQVKFAENLSIRDHFEFLRDHEDEHVFASAVIPTRATEKLESQYAAHLASWAVAKPLTTRIADLSYGQRKLLDLGFAVFRKHKVLLLDEPVAGVNQVVRKTIHTLLKQLKLAGETVVLIEHDIDFVRALADGVVVLDEGRILTHGEPQKVFADSRVMEAYLGK